MTAGPVIDLNADLGEGAGFDEDLLDLVTSANVACGAHAGDAATIVRTCLAAAERGVVVGAHPGYPDRAGFGRVAIELAEAELRRSLAEQFAAITDGARAAGLAPRYVKAHGALYHRAAEDRQTAAVLVSAAAVLQPSAAPGPLVVLGPPRPGAEPPQGGVRHVVEGFADRAYVIGRDGRPTLAQRGLPGAILAHDAAVAQAVALATTGAVIALTGEPVAVHPRSICVHGDTPGAVALAREIRSELERAGVRIEAFA